MYAEKFIEYFNKNKIRRFFSFKTFFTETFAQQTPPREKKTLSIVDDFSQIINQTKDAIIVNLYLNKSFPLNEQFTTSTIANIVDVFENKNQEITNLEARMIFLLHSSKMKGSFDDFDLIFDAPQFIEITDFQSHDLIELFSKIKNNKTIKKAIDCVIFDFTGNHVDRSDLDFISLIFFSSNYPGLNGFAGLRKVYVSSSRIDELIQEVKKIKFTEEDEKIIVHLYFVRLIIHEITHVLIRMKKDNMNFSSPIISGADLKKYDFEEKKWIESGIYGEGLIFNKKIDFHRSVGKTYGLNMSYLKQFYQDLLENQLDAPFDIEESGVIVSKGPPCVMAVDIDEQTRLIYE